MKPLMICCLLTMSYLSQAIAQPKKEWSLKKDHHLSTEEKLQFLQDHNHAFEAFDYKIRDPFVLLGPDGYYYLTGTTAGSHWGDTIGIHLWRSLDLATWEDMGFVWDMQVDGKQVNSWHLTQPVKEKNKTFKNPRAIWAPEIHFLKNTWWVPHCRNGGGHGLLKSISGKPEGPYESLPPIENRRIDAHLYQENGITYYAWQADMLVKLKDDLSGPDGTFLQLEHNGKHPLGYEGILLMKIEDKYVHIASGRYGYEPTNTYDLYYAVSDKLEGPYGKRRMALKNAGHGNLFQDKEGRWWCTAFDHEYSERWSLWLVPVDIIVKKNDILFNSLDPRFQPLKEDHRMVRKLAKTGIPPEWKDKAPWFRPEQIKK